MGKIRTKIIGLEQVEAKQKEQAKVRREQKQKREKGPKEEIEEISLKTKTEKTEVKKDKKLAKPRLKKTRGQKYQRAKKLVQESTSYNLKDAVNLLKKIGFAGFDETVELHINVKETGVKKETTLPYGTGKAIRVVVCDEAVLEKIAKGQLDFDVLIAHPSLMPKLVKYAPILGPRGLMPNPKNATLTDQPEQSVARFKKGAIQLKTEPKFPIIHQAVGKISLSEDKLTDNIQTVIKVLSPTAIVSAYIKTTMSPAIRLTLD